MPTPLHQTIVVRAQSLQIGQYLCMSKELCSRRTLGALDFLTTVCCAKAALLGVLSFLPRARLARVRLHVRLPRLLVFVVTEADWQGGNTIALVVLWLLLFGFLKQV